jgi:hypothetical protein
VRSRQLEGSFPGDPSTGTWIVTAKRILHGCGCPPESAWPYDGDASHWPPQEPPGVDKVAKRFRRGAYQRIRSVQDGRVCLALQRPFEVALRVGKQWFTAPGGAIELPEPGRENLQGSHAVTVYGYDDNTGRFKFANSWGTTWGDGGYGYLPYEYFARYLIEAWTLSTPAFVRPANPSAPSLMELQWGVNDALGGVLHGVEIYSPVDDELLAWGMAVERDGFLDVEELFTTPNSRRRGHGTRIAKLLLARGRQLQLRPRYWVPHADVNSENLGQFTRIARSMGFTLHRAKEPWAAYVALKR